MSFINRILIFSYRTSWWLINKQRFKKLGEKSYIYPPIKITPSVINCGKGVYIYKNCRIEGLKNYNNEFFDPIITLEDNVSVQQNLHLTCAKSIYIGKNTAIAANVTITDIHHPYEDINLPIECQNIRVNGVIIGEDCKIYNNVVILPGTIIGKHCTIGANSVVSGIFSDFCVIVGSPARIIKQYSLDSKKWEKVEYNNK